MTATSDYTGWTISTGFLDGNLGDAECVAAAGEYAAHLEDALQAAYPGATVRVVCLRGCSGCLPSTLKTWVTDASGYDQADHADRVDRIATQVFESYSWLPSAKS